MSDSNAGFFRRGPQGYTGAPWSENVSDGRAPARSGTGTVDATLAHIPDTTSNGGRHAVTTSEKTALAALAGLPLTVDMGGDMSAARSVRASIGPRTSCGVAISWPATQQGQTPPAGKWAIRHYEGLDSPVLKLISVCDEEEDPEGYADVQKSQPSGDGSAGSIEFRRIYTDQPFVDISFTPESGGVGVVPNVRIF